MTVSMPSPDADLPLAERLARADAHLKAFVCFDPAGFAALDTAVGPLAGVTLGVKDAERSERGAGVSRRGERVWVPACAGMTVWWVSG